MIEWEYRPHHSNVSSLTDVRHLLASAEVRRGPENAMGNQGLDHFRAEFKISDELLQRKFRTRFRSPQVISQTVPGFHYFRQTVGGVNT
jgi:hypothetical protein